METISIENHGQLIVSTDYWRSDMERHGKLFLSPNAGAIRLLIPRAHRAAINDMRAAKHCVLSRGPWPDGGATDAIEILFDDVTQSPFSLHLTPASCALLPAQPPEGQDWLLTVWDFKKNKPHKCLERKCYWRTVSRLPCLLPFGRSSRNE